MPEKPQNLNQKEGQNEIEDIFSEANINQQASADVLAQPQVKETNQQAVGPNQPQNPSSATPVLAQETKKAISVRFNNLKKPLMVLLLLVILIGLGWLVWKYQGGVITKFQNLIKLGNKQSEYMPVEQLGNNDLLDGSLNNNQGNNQEENQGNEGNLLNQEKIIPVIIDSDQDGLSDLEEIELGTNPNLADSDQDGLTDKEEVKIYQTNPLVLDTDKDGVSDGQEVLTGFDPNNPDPGARLLNLNQAIQGLK